MLYTVITFVALFIIATVCAVIFYVKAEDFKTQLNNQSNDMANIALEKEQRSLTKVIGKKLKGKSYLGTLVSYLDDMLSATTGKLPEDELTLEEKVNNAKIKINETISALGESASGTYGPEGIDLVQTIITLKSDFDTANHNLDMTRKLLNDLQDEFDIAVENFRIEEQRLIDEKNHYQTEADNIQQNYDQLNQKSQQSADEQVDAYKDKLKKSEATLKQKNLDFIQLQAKLDKTQQALQTAIIKLEDIKPRPDIEVAAFKPDAGVVSVDMQTNTVFIDAGSSDHVYVGLTFSIYDKNAPIPEDGVGKAQIEVFGVTETVSAARFVYYSRKNPVVPEDIAVNLIWDSEKSNSFVVAGNFDFDRDGKIDHDGKEKIVQLIERWGGRIVDDVSIETDFVVLGKKPRVMKKPSRYDYEIDPMSRQRYETSQRKASEYNGILARANTFSVPVFNLARFLNLIGYETLAAKSTPFY